jgi:prophage endopeptidase
MNPYFWLGALIACLLSFGAGDWHGHSAASAADTTRNAKADTGVANAKAEVTQDVADAEKHVARLLDNRDAQHQKENDDAQRKITALHADVAAGRLQLSIATRKASQNTHPGDPAAGNQEARTDLLPETADAFIDAATESASDVRDLNSCVDSYNDVRDAYNALRLQLLK